MFMRQKTRGGSSYGKVGIPLAIHHPFMKFCVFLSSLLCAATLVQAFEVADLRCEDLVAPVGVDLAQPKLSWQMEDAGHTRGQK
jgi:hypothetical protein